MKRLFLLGISTTVLLSGTVSTFAQTSSYPEIEEISKVNGYEYNDYYSDMSNSLEYGHISHDKVSKYDNYVTIKDDIFVITEEGYSTLSQNELSELTFILDSTNSNIVISKSAAAYHYVQNDAIVITDSMVESFSGGVNRIEYYWWGARVYVSASTLRTIGNGVAIAGIWVPHPIVSKVSATVGVIISQATRGIWFDVSPFSVVLPTTFSNAGFQ